MLNHPYLQAKFLKSAAKTKQLPEDSGHEVAFAGRSNAGKSSALNCLTNQKGLAKTSKTPGRTQLINVFTLADESKRLIDLPGYGYAKVSLETKLAWQKNLSSYLNTRSSLKGLILVMDCRHPLKKLDLNMIDWAMAANLPVHILLTKSDKLSRSDINNTLSKVTKKYPSKSNSITAQAFSATKKQGVDTLVPILNQWLDIHSNQNSTDSLPNSLS